MQPIEKKEADAGTIAPVPAEAELTLFHWIIAFVTTLVCLLIILNYGWICYATLTDRPGLNGDLYQYSDLSKNQFAAFNFVITLLACIYLLSLAFFIWKGNRKGLRALFWCFLLFLMLITTAELILAARFVPKG